jgi:glutamate synthase domain-containing protein 2
VEPVVKVVEPTVSPARYLLLAFAPRYIVYTLSLIGTLAFGLASFHDTWFLVPFAIAGGLAILGTRDLAQTQRSLLRNYPIAAHIRFLLEEIRPEIRQYFLESDTDGMPFNRNKRSIVYQRAKGDLDKRPFGTMLDVYSSGFEWINHSIAPKTHAGESFRTTVGGPDCRQPYSCSVFNISAMSFGALSANAIRALNRGAATGGFAHDTGEGGFSQYHQEFGGDIIWELGSGYFGCRNPDGSFNPERFAAQVKAPQVKMVEIKLSQGAKPGHGGVLPGPKVSAEIAAARGVQQGVDCVSPASHPAFSTPLGLVAFIKELRELSGGKPVGFKLCIGHPTEFLGICKAMLETGIYPDFIVVDGSEGGTGAAPLEFLDHMGTPLRDGLVFVHNTLVGLGIRERIKIGAGGKITSAFDMARVMALGADWCNAARGFMFAVGCIQSQSCHTDTCPAGVATQDKTRQRALVVPDKAQRVAQFHKSTVKALGEVIAAAGLSHPSELRPHHISRRVASNQCLTFAELYRFTKKGEILAGTDHPSFVAAWPAARADSFSGATG